MNASIFSSQERENRVLMRNYEKRVEHGLRKSNSQNKVKD